MNPPLPPLVGDCSEDELVAALTSGLPLGKRVIVGPGDDCAVVRPRKKKLLLKTDCLLENIHFLREHPPHLVGWKALCRPTSDIAAMAGTPDCALVTAAFPPSLPTSYALEIYRGISLAAKHFSISIAGGETSRSPSPEIFLSVAMTGWTNSAWISRAGAKNGDGIWVTGALGGSFKTGHHLRFRPRLPEARWLAANNFASSMMDLSDGLASDLPRICKQSSLGFSLDLPAIPVKKGFSLQSALSDGEDYELLFSCPAAKEKKLAKQWRTRFPNLLLTKIGTLQKNGQTALSVSGFQHFYH